MKKSAQQQKKEYIESYRKNKQVSHYKSIFKYASDHMIHDLEIYFTKKQISSGDKKYLDCACGFGRIVCNLEKYFSQTFGFDTSSQMMRIAKKNCNKAKFKVGDAEKIPFKKNTFDFETNFRFIMNFEKPVRMKMLKEFNRVLKKDGTLVINIHRNKYGFRGLYQIFRNLILKENGPYLSYYAAQKELKAAGFDVEKVYGIKTIPFWRGHVFLPYGPLLVLEKFLAYMPLLKYIADGLIIVARKR